MAALLNCSMSQPEKVVNFISECKEMGIEVLPPDVNQSVNEFTVSFLHFELTTKSQSILKRLEIPDSLLEILRFLENKVFKTKNELLVELKKLGDDHIRESEQILSFQQVIVRAMRVEAVRFGLNAVKNVGGNAVDAILEARTQKKENRFTNFMEFMKTVDMTKVSSRVLESFIKCGAFDSLNPNRAQLLLVLDEAIHLGQEFQKADDPMQNSLFDLLSEEESKNTETQLNFPEMKDWTIKQRLTYEKEALGFYVSGHPLDHYEYEIKKLAITTHDLEENGFKDGDSVALAGIIISNTVRLSKRNERFAIINLEDQRGSIEIPVYAKLYAEVQDLLEKEEPVLVQGRVNYRDDDGGRQGFSLIAENIRWLSHIRQETCNKVVIVIRQTDDFPEFFTSHQLQLFIEMLLTFPGKSRIYFHLYVADGCEIKILLQESVALVQNLVEYLVDLFGVKGLVFVY